MTDPTTVTKLDELLTAIRAYPDPRRAAAEWKQVFKLLQSTDLPATAAAGIVGMRDVARLAEVVEKMRSPAAAPLQGEAVDPEECKRALRAFRKRSGLMRLDEESRLGRSPLSKGSVPQAAAIVPPDEWPEAVWQELVRQGKLRHIGGGFYVFVKD